MGKYLARLNSNGKFKKVQENYKSNVKFLPHSNSVISKLDLRPSNKIRNALEDKKLSNCYSLFSKLIGLNRGKYGI